MIFETFGLRSNTIYYFFKKHNISLRTISESEKIALLENRVKFNRKKNQYKSG